MRDRRFKFGAGTRAELCDCIRKSPAHFGISTMKATVIGAHGFIGRHLVMEFKRRGWACRPLGRVSREELGEDHLGHVVYCAGVTSDFLARPWDTVTAHVAGIREVVEYANYNSLLYLSSTRVYLRNRSTDKSSSIEVNSAERDELYNLTKLLGENVCRFSQIAGEGSETIQCLRPGLGGANFLIGDNTYGSCRKNLVEIEPPVRERLRGAVRCSCYNSEDFVGWEKRYI